MTASTPPGSPLQGVVVATPKAGHEPDWIEVGHGVESWLTAAGLIAGALWAIFGDWRKSKAEREAERSLRERERLQREDQIKQQEQKLRWDQTKIALEINEEFLDDDDAQQVLKILDSEFNDTACTVTDWEDEDAPKKHTFNLKAKEDVLALRITTPAPTDKEIFLRDCFDAWFYWMAVIEQYLQNGLIREEDIAYPSDYYVRSLKEDADLYSACQAYIRHYRLSPKIEQFMKRFSGASTGSATAAEATP